MFELTEKENDFTSYDQSKVKWLEPVVLLSPAEPMALLVKDAVEIF